jgi:four helix bundle protein
MREGDEDRWKSLEIWQVADQMALDVYHVTRAFPPEERFGITSQLRRAALSIPTNIVEGYSRRGDREFAHFVNIALGSLAETKYLLHFARRLDYVSSEAFDALAAGCDRLGRQLWRFYENVSGA